MFQSFLVKRNKLICRRTKIIKNLGTDIVYQQNTPPSQEHLSLHITVALSVEDGVVAQSVEHWTANLATRVRYLVVEEPSDLICAFLHVQMESNWAGLSVCNCRHNGK